MSKLVVATLMGIILLVLCVKLFCCRKSQSTTYETAEQSQDSDDADKAELTRIHSASNKQKNGDQGEFSPARQQAEIELARADDEDDDPQ
jgi:hypothetical protein